MMAWWPFVLLRLVAFQATWLIKTHVCFFRYWQESNVSSVSVSVCSKLCLVVVSLIFVWFASKIHKRVKVVENGRIQNLFTHHCSLCLIVAFLFLIDTRWRFVPSYMERVGNLGVKSGNSAERHLLPLPNDGSLKYQDWHPAPLRQLLLLFWASIQQYQPS